LVAKGCKAFATRKVKSSSGPILPYPLNMKKTIVAALIVGGLMSTLLDPALTYSADLPKMPPTVDVRGQTLQLNGAGLRTATILHVKVYEAGLYLPHRSTNAQQIINSQDPKAIRMTFLRDVSANQARDAWQDDFKNNCAPNCAALQPGFNQLVSRITDAKTGDVFVYVFTKDGIHIVRNGKEIDHAEDPRLARTILSFWLGKAPPSADLKQAMLGIVPNEDVS
jgi:hypothetical protein